MTRFNNVHRYYREHYEMKRLREEACFWKAAFAACFIISNVTFLVVYWF